MENNAEAPRYTIGVDTPSPIDPIYVGILVNENGIPEVHGWTPSPNAFQNGPAHVTVVCVDRAKRTREIPMNESGVSLEAFVVDPHVVASVACAACENEWVAVAPDGTDLGALVCPKCGKQHTNVKP